MLKKISAVTLALMLGAVSIFAQDAQVRELVNGQKYKIKGVIVSKEDSSSFIIRDGVGVDTRVVIAPNASI